MVLRPGYDWFYPYYRDRALCLTLGVTPHEMLQQAVGSADDPASGGRQMPSHWGDKATTSSGSSPTGTQFAQSVGCADATRYRNEHTDEVTLVCAATAPRAKASSGRALNIACLKTSAGAVPGRRQRLRDFGPGRGPDRRRQHLEAGERLSGALRHEVDGTDFVASHRVMKRAAAYCRAGRGRRSCTRTSSAPIRTRFPTTRGSTRRRPSAKPKPRRDPIQIFPEFLVHEGILDRRGWQRSPRSRREVDEATACASAEAPPAAGFGDRFICIRRSRSNFAASSKRSPISRRAARPWSTPINRTLAGGDAARCSGIMVFGEDVADCSREEASAGEGQRWRFQGDRADCSVEFGAERCFNTPIAEAGIVGRAIGHGDARVKAGGRRFSFSITSGLP